MDLSTIKPDVVNDVVKVPEITLKKSGNFVEFQGKKITNSNDAYSLFMEIWNKDLIEAQEQAYVLFLNNNNRPIGYYHHSTGAINATIQDVEIISAMAVKSLCKGVIIAHNHPSGVLQPSDADIRVSKNMKNALNLFHIVLADSLIITKDGYLSLAEKGEL